MIQHWLVPLQLILQLVGPHAINVVRAPAQKWHLALGVYYTNIFILLHAHVYLTVYCDVGFVLPACLAETNLEFTVSWQDDGPERQRVWAYWRQTDHISTVVHDRAAAAQVVSCAACRRRYQQAITLNNCQLYIVDIDFETAHASI